MKHPIYSQIIATGGYVPERCVTNAELEQKVDTSDAWIVERTGIRQRYIAAENERTSDMAVKAAEIALKRAGKKPADIDAVILATTTPDLIFPSTATKVQQMLGIKSGFAFDIQAVCAGFIYALAVADNFIRTSQAKRILVIGADTLSRIVDWKDRGTCILFGDGAGAVLLEASTEPGILSTRLYSDGETRDLLYVDETSRTIKMTGKEVFKHAVQKLSDTTLELLKEQTLGVNDIDWLIPHQANQRILEAVGKRLGLAAEKMVSTVAEHANTSAASIPLALHQAVIDNKIKPGQLLAMQAIGGGLAWGAALIRV